MLPTAEEIREIVQMFSGCPELFFTNSLIEHFRDEDVIPYIEQVISAPLLTKENKIYLHSSKKSKRILLSNLAITEIISIQDVVNNYTIPSSQYTFDQKKGIVYFDNYFPRGEYNIKVNTYIGWDEDFPDDVKIAIIRLTCAMLLIWDAGKDGGTTSISGESLNKTYAKGVKHGYVINNLISLGHSKLSKYIPKVTGD